METLSLLTLEIGNALYRVYDLSHGFENGFRKNNAYIVKTDLDTGVYPYRGELKSFKKMFLPDNDLKPGIYALEDSDPAKIQIYHATGKEAELYSLDAIVNLADIDIKSKIKSEDIIKVKMNTSGGDSWMPELKEDDDATSTLLKSAIRLKHMVFADYAPRLEYDAVGKGQGSKGVSAKSNSKRAIENNQTTSMNKMLYYCNSFDLDLVIGVRDRLDARDPMFQDGKVLLLYPFGDEFPLDNTVTVSEMKHEIDTAHLTASESEDDDIYSF